MKQVYVLRHAPKYDTTGDLTEEGKGKAIDLQNKLPSFNLVISSDSPRTQETAILLTKIQPQIDRRAGYFNAPKEISDKINNQAKSHPAGFTGAYLDNEQIKEYVNNQAKELKDLIFETLEKLGSDDKALIISHDITMVPAEKLLTDGPYTKSFNYLSGYIVNGNKEFNRYSQ